MDKASLTYDGTVFQMAGDKWRKHTADRCVIGSYDITVCRVNEQQSVWCDVRQVQSNIVPVRVHQVDKDDKMWYFSNKVTTCASIKQTSAFLLQQNAKLFIFIVFALLSFCVFYCDFCTLTVDLGIWKGIG